MGHKIMREIVLSIKPFYAGKILSGEKKVELRKKVGRDFLPGNFIYIYSSHPIKEITGTARISQVQNLKTSDIRDRFLLDACISQEDFDSYFCGYDEGYLIWLEDVKTLEKRFPLSDLRSSGFNPPQSYCYLSDSVRFLLEG